MLQLAIGCFSMREISYEEIVCELVENPGIENSDNYMVNSYVRTQQNEIAVFHYAKSDVGF